MAHYVARDQVEEDPEHKYEDARYLVLPLIQSLEFDLFVAFLLLLQIEVVGDVTVAPGHIVQVCIGVNLEDYYVQGHAKEVGEHRWYLLMECLAELLAIVE